MTAATPNDDSNHHTHKELTTLIDVAHVTIEKEDAKMPDGQPGRIHLRNDDVSGVANVNKPGKHSRMRQQMVDPQMNFVKALCERSLFWTGPCISKCCMDVTSTMDHDGRKDLHNGEFQMHPEALQKVLKRLNMNIDFDLFVTRSTKQASCDHEKLEDGAASTNALIHDWANHPALKGKSLCAFPPPSLAEAAVEKSTEHPINLLLILPLWVEAKTHWEPLQGMIHSHVATPPSLNLHKHPHGKPMPRSKIPSWPLVASCFCASVSKDEKSMSKQCKPSSGTKMGSTTPTGSPLNPCSATSETGALAALVTGQQN